MYFRTESSVRYTHFSVVSYSVACIFALLVVSSDEECLLMSRVSVVCFLDSAFCVLFKKSSLLHYYLEALLAQYFHLVHDVFRTDVCLRACACVKCMACV